MTLNLTKVPDADLTSHDKGAIEGFAGVYTIEAYVSLAERSLARKHLQSEAYNQYDLAALLMDYAPQGLIKSLAAEALWAGRGEF